MRANTAEVHVHQPVVGPSRTQAIVKAPGFFAQCSGGWRLRVRGACRWRFLPRSATPHVFPRGCHVHKSNRSQDTPWLTAHDEVLRLTTIPVGWVKTLGFAIFSQRSWLFPEARDQPDNLHPLRLHVVLPTCSVCVPTRQRFCIILWKSQRLAREAGGSTMTSSWIALRAPEKPELMRWRAALAPRHVPVLEDHTSFGDQRSATHHIHTLCHVDAPKIAEMANLEKSDVTHDLQEIPCDLC